MSQQINLFNPIFLKQKKYFSTVTMLQALGLILAGAVLLSVYASFQLNNLNEEAEATSGQLKAAQAQVARLNATGTRARSQALEAQVQKLETEIVTLQRVQETLRRGDFGDTAGYSEYLRAFSRQIVDGLWLTGFSIQGAGNEIGIQGRTVQPDLVPAYISRLKREPIMRGKSFAALEMQAPAANDKGAPGYVEFNLHTSEAAKPAAEGGGK